MDMRRIADFLAMTVVLLAPNAFTQTNPPAVTSAAACPATASLDELVKALDDAVSGPANKDRTCFRDLFLADARLIPIRIAADGTATPRTLTVQDWIDAVAKRGSNVFYERQVKVKTEVYGHMAHLWSTYETRTTPDGKAEVRGINSIQAIYDGSRWRVMEIVWQAETPTELVPKQYLP